MSKKTSSIYQPKLPTDIVDIAIKMVSSMPQYSTRYSKEKTIVLRYEDLIASPLPSVNFIFELLGIPTTNDSLAYLKQQDEPEDFMAWKNRVKERPGYLKNWTL